MDACNARGGGTRLALSKAVEVGVATLERIVGDVYEWRDAEHCKKRRIVFDDGG